MATQTKTCVYTILVGEYEALNEQPVAARSDIPFICLTDDSRLTSQTWKVVHVPTAFGMDPVRSQRIHKICPHLVDAFAEFDRSLYIDNSVILSATPEEIIERYPMTAGIGLPTHSFRESVMDEFIEVARLGFDEQVRIFEQLNHYMTQGDPSLAERPHWTAILLRNHSDPLVRKAMGRWASHVLRYSRRDQLSFNAALRDVGLTPDRWDIDNHQSWFHTWPHMPHRERFAGPRNPMVSHMPPNVRIRLEQEQAAAAKQAADTLRGQLESMTAERDQARGELEDAKRQLGACRMQLEHENQLLRDSLESARREADATIAATVAAIHASTSWRVAAPLRQLKRWIA
ncbi:glycosyltransferase domain-containing protein [Variovorax robiniae]|uniref:Glycosyltransferase domain-containing protein n=1 Tax=Variovorax robiniae TaxID=1836199 RepID=A0ABU8X4Z6_9BURK